MTFDPDKESAMMFLTATEMHAIAVLISQVEEDRLVYASMSTEHKNRLNEIKRKMAAKWLQMMEVAEDEGS